MLSLRFEVNVTFEQLEKLARVILLLLVMLVA